MNAISDFLRSIGTTRLIAGIAILSLVGGALTTAMIRLADKDMTVLFTDLDLQDASRITETLKSDGIDYEQRGQGTVILVPSDKVLDLRMRFASEGLPARGIAGYELLDNQSPLGTTSFLQNVNYIRALEGELARTIGSLDAVRAARVFLNLPKRELFSRETQPATASIQIDTTHGTMTRQQVRAVQYLVASAVKGLSPQRVSVIDEQGNVLASGQGDGPDAVAGSLEERRLALERNLQTEIEQILLRIVGPGNARVRVSAQMNFNRVVEETRTWDPDRQVVVSTRTIEESANTEEGRQGNTVSVANNLPDAQQGTEGSGTASAENRLDETVNYENSLTKRTEVQEAGRLERLSVAVVLNERTSVGEDGTVTYAPRSEDELKTIDSLVRAAVGYDEDRGDQVEVISTRFAEIDPLDLTENDTGLFGANGLDIYRIIESVALVLLALIFLFALQPLIRRLLSPRPSADNPDTLEAQADVPRLAPPDQTGLPADAQGAVQSQNMAALPAPDGEEGGSSIDISKVEGKVKESSIRKVGELVAQHPEESMSILRSWIHETT